MGHPLSSGITWCLLQIDGIAIVFQPHLVHLLTSTPIDLGRPLPSAALPVRDAIGPDPYAEHIGGFG